MIHMVRSVLEPAEASKLTPAGLSLPVPAQRVRSCSTRSPRYVSRTIERAALGTESGSPVHS